MSFFNFIYLFISAPPLPPLILVFASGKQSWGTWHVVCSSTRSLKIDLVVFFHLNPFKLESLIDLTSRISRSVVRTAALLSIAQPQMWPSRHCIDNFTSAFPLKLHMGSFDQWRGKHGYSLRQTLCNFRSWDNEPANQSYNPYRWLIKGPSMSLLSGGNVGKDRWEIKSNI